jgi:hypothetical protein
MSDQSQSETQPQAAEAASPAETITVPVAEYEATGVIVLTHRSGWKLKDQLIRSAQVVVAK